MKKIKELLVVEGRHDVDNISRFLCAEFICTNGLGISDETLETIVTASENQGVIVLLDPDGPGEAIRRKIMEKAPLAHHAYLAKKDAIGKRNVGVEYADEKVIMEALSNCVTYINENESLSWQDYLNLGLVGDSQLREKLCAYLHIAPCNNRTLFKRLNGLNLSSETLSEIIESF